MSFNTKEQRKKNTNEAEADVISKGKYNLISKRRRKTQKTLVKKK